MTFIGGEITRRKNEMKNTISNIKKYGISAVAGAALASPALAQYTAPVDLTSVGTDGASAAGDGATKALPIFAALVGLTVLVRGFMKLRRG